MRTLIDAGDSVGHCALRYMGANCLWSLASTVRRPRSNRILQPCLIRRRGTRWRCRAPPKTRRSGWRRSVDADSTRNGPMRSLLRFRLLQYREHWVEEQVGEALATCLRQRLREYASTLGRSARSIQDVKKKLHQKFIINEENLSVDRYNAGTKALTKETNGNRE